MLSVMPHPVDDKRLHEHRWQIAVAVVFFLVSLATFVASCGGADSPRYLDWGHAFMRGDLYLVRSSVTAPSGVPLTQWSFGPGLVFAVGGMIAGELRTGAYLLGWGLSVLTFLVLLRLATVRWGARRALIAFGLLLLGTPVGFVTATHASESMGVAGLAMLLWLAHDRQVPGGLALLLAGPVVGWLLAVRPQFVLYLVPALLVLLLRRPEGGKGLGLVAWVGLGGLTAALTTAKVNQWMTGSPLQSPYVAADELYSNVMLFDPEFAAVLLHPLHGLLSHHPLYLVGVVAGVRALTSTSARDERRIIGAWLVVLFGHLWLQAGWYGWWQGGACFGQRGMTIAGLVAVGLLLHHLTRPSTGEAERRGFLLAGLLCALFSLPLFAAFAGSFPMANTWAVWRELWLGGAATLVLPSLLSVVVVAGAYAAVFRCRPDLEVMIVVVLVAGMLAVGWVRIFARAPFAPGWIGGHPVSFMVLFMGLFGVSVALFRLLRGDLAPELVARVVLVAACVVTVLGGALFGSLVARTDADIAKGRRHRARVTSTVHLRELRMTLVEYEAIPGFDDKKAALRAYIERAEARASAGAP
jgi:hypothetical protein